MSEVGMRMRQAKIGEFIEEELWVGQEILPFGADIKSQVEEILRIAFQNINGISYNTDKTADEEIDAMDTFGIDILGLAETNISWTMEQRLQLATAIQLKFSGGRAITSAMKSKTTGYLPGGSATICQGPASGRVFCRGSDPLGRFTWMALRGQDGTGVILVTGYRVSQKRVPWPAPTLLSCGNGKHSEQWERRIQTQEITTYVMCLNYYMNGETGGTTQLY